MFLSGQCPGGAGLGQVLAWKVTQRISGEHTNQLATARVGRARNELGRTSWNKQKQWGGICPSCTQGVLRNGTAVTCSNDSLETE